MVKQEAQRGEGLALDDDSDHAANEGAGVFFDFVADLIDWENYCEGLGRLVAQNEPSGLSASNAAVVAQRAKTDDGVGEVGGEIGQVGVVGHFFEPGAKGGVAKPFGLDVLVVSGDEFDPLGVLLGRARGAVKRQGGRLGGGGFLVEGAVGVAEGERVGFGSVGQLGLEESGPLGVADFFIVVSEPSDEEDEAREQGGQAGPTDGVAAK